MRWALPFLLVLLVMTAGCDGMPTDRPLFIVDQAAEVGGLSVHVHTVQGGTEVLTHSNWAHSVSVNLTAAPAANATDLAVLLLDEQGQPLPFDRLGRPLTGPTTSSDPAAEGLNMVFEFQAQEGEHDGVSVHDVDALALEHDGQRVTIERPASPTSDAANETPPR